MTLSNNDDLLRSRRQPRSNNNPVRGLAASAHISRHGINEVLVLPMTGVEDRVPISIDVASYSDDDLEDLKRSDPFMYFSIPSVREANLRWNDSHYQQEARRTIPLSPDQRDHPCRRSMPAGSMRPFADDDSVQVRRQSRISFESHSSVVMSELCEDLESDDDLDDYLNSFFG